MIYARRNIVIALPPEAKPLIRTFELERLQPVTRPPVYTGRDLALVVSGAGEKAVHESVYLLQNLNRHPNPYWYNFGIAGHADLPLGTLLTINQVTDQKTKKTWRLPIQPVARAPGCNLVTVETAVDDYPGSASYDMEAAGFTGAVSQLAELEQIRIIKIISDNQTNSHRRISGKMVSALIQAKIDIIEQLLSGPVE
ncbi:MAG: hypothetical protein DIZ77_02210 [endosymbiont of Seepiophila jonesi]|uniref:Nucleoside phosphorylase domain-containing protein n=1 Tax=endosymbiont of Lamellibrachia luymesi TaxID=2200907 RepID=A0A370E0K7_9GAMM|nr:MAG: hypothetical protein DIZ79_02520 [endosymbiont of Lamellibrachia luymesi]RDH94232.1 MAG: hypothetical protein DIZ77_02210 [endosymbiont of Seepiophila jonesi]